MCWILCIGYSRSISEIPGAGNYPGTVIVKLYGQDFATCNRINIRADYCSTLAVQLSSHYK